MAIKLTDIPARITEIEEKIAILNARIDQRQMQIASISSLKKKADRALNALKQLQRDAEDFNSVYDEIRNAS